MTINIDKLTSAIMNIPCKRDDEYFSDESFRDAESRVLYKEGHRDARHAAVEVLLDYRKNVFAAEKPAGDLTDGSLEQMARSSSVNTFANAL